MSLKGLARTFSLGRQTAPGQYTEWPISSFIRTTASTRRKRHWLFCVLLSRLFIPVNLSSAAGKSPMGTLLPMKIVHNSCQILHAAFITVNWNNSCSDATLAVQRSRYSYESFGPTKPIEALVGGWASSTSSAHNMGTPPLMNHPVDQLHKKYGYVRTSPYVYTRTHAKMIHDDDDIAKEAL